MSDIFRDTLPLLPEIWEPICSHLSAQDGLLCLRLTSSQLNLIALPYAFKSLHLKAYGTSAERFTTIAKSTKLRGFVRELTINTSIGPGFEYHANGTYDIPSPFLNALPYLRCFSKITALHLRFNEFCGDSIRGRSSVKIEESWDFRYSVLDTIFHCITGIWTQRKQIEIDQLVDLDGYEPEYPNDDLGIPSDQVLQIKQLTISNLADYHDSYFYSSEAWKKFLCLSSLVDLKLVLATEIDSAEPERSVFFEEKYEMFDNLPQTWLSPSLGENLRSLSLYYQGYWGWFPMMDFRKTGGDSPFPRLKVLALGKYVFSEGWEIDWFASVGKNNGSHGLEELYLDDCPILFQSRDLGMNRTALGANPHQASTRDLIAAHSSPVVYKHTMRWHHVLSRWANSMRGLRIFRMGLATFDAAQRKEAFAHLDEDGLDQRIFHNIRRNLAFPSPVDDMKGHGLYLAGQCLHGTKISQWRSARMQYVKFDVGKGPSPYLGACDNPSLSADGCAPEEGTVARDDAAYERLIVATRVRALRSEARGLSMATHSPDKSSPFNFKSGR
ncbi:hypothetical protein BGZ61DRAFT_358438 [Ilyonectria robusta]|uniref:uncharacterized protein n=1 Tax=Ilyonectria robusta TaxID=1079257 RepID=UPI001E8DDF5E|nr:uncharacterized protein BGZ61DRAFT_358438 [Ilyonectria robusta]KAH8680181.1 hypothetical protein BGZ61DRAFT_358438 [Ilyonectria robusta]